MFDEVGERPRFVVLFVCAVLDLTWINILLGHLINWSLVLGLGVVVSLIVGEV